MSAYKNVLVAVDLSNEARQVVGKAKAVADAFSAEFTLIHVIEPLMTESPYDLTPVAAVDVESTLIDRAEDFLEQLVKDCGLKHAKKLVRLGAVKMEILNLAKESSTDLIVVGSHGRHGISILLGSTANAILHGTPCDVLAVRVGE